MINISAIYTSTGYMQLQNCKIGSINLVNTRLSLVSETQDTMIVEQEVCHDTGPKSFSGSKSNSFKNNIT